MTYLILGAEGMLGSALVGHLAGRHATHASMRAACKGPVIADVTIHDRQDVRDEAALTALVENVRPKAIVNAVGLVKQLSGSVGVEDFIAVNALFPHRLASIAARNGARLIHIGTDCVYSGRAGFYKEADAADPVDAYGMTKLLGEPSAPHVCVLRCSLIGLESVRPDRAARGLVDWFLAQKPKAVVPGFARARFSAVTTTEMARVIERVAERQEPLSGIWHVAAPAISKLDLLQSLRARLPHLTPDIARSEEPVIDRSLDGGAFSRAMGYETPDWDRMLDELAGQILRRAAVATTA
jgi:dTDP-4-dehydrorhamnose reductase